MDFARYILLLFVGININNIDLKIFYRYNCLGKIKQAIEYINFTRAIYFLFIKLASKFYKKYRLHTI